MDTNYDVTEFWSFVEFFVLSGCWRWLLFLLWLPIFGALRTVTYYVVVIFSTSPKLTLTYVSTISFQTQVHWLLY